MLVLFSDGGCLAQPNSDAPATVETELGRFGVALTLPALRAALLDRRSQVRGLAATELAEMKDATDAPLIAKSLALERSPLTRIDMASALVILRSKIGNAALEDLCNDASLSDGLRLRAMSALVDAEDSRCLPALEAIIERTSDSSIKISGLLYLARIKARGTNVPANVHSILLNNLQDQNASVRQYTGACIASLRDTSALGPLRQAIVKETDSQTRIHLQQSLASLEGNAQGH